MVKKNNRSSSLSQAALCSGVILSFNYFLNAHHISLLFMTKADPRIHVIVSLNGTNRILFSSA